MSPITTTDLVIAELMAASPSMSPRMGRMSMSSMSPRMGRMSRRMASPGSATAILAQELGGDANVQAFLGTGRRMSKSRKVSGKTRARKPCPPSKPYRSQVAPFRCLKHGSVAARKQGICPPRTDKSGRLRQYVSVTVPGRSPYTGNIVQKKRCVVAGGRLAKAAHVGTGCPKGKVQALVTKRVPTWIYERRANGKTYKTPKTNASGKQVVRTVVTSQCVWPRGKHLYNSAGNPKKMCPVGKVLASKRQSGTTPTGSYNRQVVRCVKPSTAARPGYTILKTGHLPGPAYKRSKGAGNLERTRNPKLRSKKKKQRRAPIRHTNPAHVKFVGQNLGWRGSAAAAPSMTSLMAMAMSPRMVVSLGSPVRRSTRRMA